MSTALSIPDSAGAGPVPVPSAKDSHRGHRVRLRVGIAVAMMAIVSIAWYGWPYYRLTTADRINSPLHPIFRASGTVGLRLGMLGLALYVVLFLYAIRKRVKWLSRIGKSGNWIDFHVLCGISAPLIITLHSSFKLGGLAGVSYWVMMSVALSGFVGRYLYGQIPRRLNAAELSHNEMESLASDLTRQMEQQKMFTADEIAGLLELPSRERVQAMSIPAVLLTMLWLDLKRPLLVRNLRVRFLSRRERVRTLAGLLPSSNQDLEQVIAAVRGQTWLRIKMLFLERTQAVFHLWHVVHRPFSYSFAVLVTIHIAVVLLLGYY